MLAVAVLLLPLVGLFSHASSAHHIRTTRVGPALNWLTRIPAQEWAEQLARCDTVMGRNDSGSGR